MHGAMGGGTNGAGHVNMGLPYKAYKAEQVSAMQVRYPRLAIGRLGGSRARRILDGLPTEMVAGSCCREGVTVDATSLKSWPGIKKTEIWRTHTVS